MLSTVYGQVVDKGNDSTFGKFIVVRDLIDGVVEVAYAHLTSISGLSIGDIVYNGQELGVEGSTGVVTGAHLHISTTKVWNGWWGNTVMFDSKKWMTISGVNF